MSTVVAIRNAGTWPTMQTDLPPTMALGRVPQEGEWVINGNGQAFRVYKVLFPDEGLAIIEVNPQ